MALRGWQLAGVLLPASSLPSGYKLNPATLPNTGSQPPSDVRQPVPASQVCQDFEDISFVLVGGVNTGDFAQRAYNAGQSATISEEVDVFTGTDAQQVMTRLWRDFGKCSSFSYQYNGITASNTLTRSRLRRDGVDAIKAVIVSPEFEGGMTLVAIRVDSQVITVLDSSAGSDLGSPAVHYAEQIEWRLVATGAANFAEQIVRQMQGEPMQGEPTQGNGQGTPPSIA